MTQTSFKPFGVLVEFKSVWDPIFCEWSNAPDGFIIVHFATPEYTWNVSFTLNVPEKVEILGSNSHFVGSVEAKSVSSWFVPIKLYDEKGEFKIELIASGETGILESVKKEIFVIREHRRKIFGLQPWEYVEYLRNKKLEGVQKREGALYYKPYDMAWEITQPQVELPSEKDPFWGGVDFGSIDFNPVPATDILEDFEYVESATREFFINHCYKFRGKVEIKDPESGILRPVAGITVKAYDYDPTSGDDIICETVTDGNGNYECSGCAHDPCHLWCDEPPEPYVVVYSANDKVKIWHCRWPWPDELYEVRSGELDGRILEHTVDFKIQEGKVWEAFSVYYYAARTYATIKSKSGWSDIGIYEYCFPANRDWYECIPGVISYEDRKINISEINKCTISHESGHRLHDFLYDQGKMCEVFWNDFFPWFLLEDTALVMIVIRIICPD